MPARKYPEHMTPAMVEAEQRRAWSGVAATSPFSGLLPVGTKGQLSARKIKLVMQPTVELSLAEKQALPRRIKAKLDTSVQTDHRKVRVAAPRINAARIYITGQVIYRLTSTSGSHANGGLNILTVYRDGEPIVVVPTPMRDPLGYIKKHPKSKWRVALVSEIMGSAGVDHKTASSILDAPLRVF